MAEKEKFYRARLDADRVYWGVEEVASLADSDVEVPEDCDLKPGHYRHDANALPVPRFEPLNREKKRDAPEAPSLERCMYALIKSIPNPPAHCVEWLRWYEKSMDASKENIDSLGAKKS